jgi:hypothetical protein
LIAQFALIKPMSAGLLDHDAAHPPGDVAMHRIEQSWSVLVALFLLAGQFIPAASTGVHPSAGFRLMRPAAD